tara:strand:+ start:12641 stop:13171 length:531 start_codon:yes stop_codon:yes gene_type:complete
MGNNFSLESNQKLLSLISTFLEVENSSMETKLTEICALLKKKNKDYDWVGFYFSNHKTKTLHLKAFAGIRTDHTTIPFGKGICGQVAVSDKNFVVDDVSSKENYIACDINVKSEIVVPILVNQTNIGQIDIDSNTINAFNQKDVLLLERVNNLVGNYILSNNISINITKNDFKTQN